MTIKHKINIDKDKKVITLLVDVPRKILEKDENLSFNGTDAWELVKNTRVEGYKLNYKRNGLVVDNWRRCNHTGVYVYPLEETRPAKPKEKESIVSKPEKKSKPSTRKRSTKQNKD